jgi:hypothetical protein
MKPPGRHDSNIRFPFWSRTMNTWQWTLTTALFSAGLLAGCNTPSVTVERSTVNGLPSVVQTQSASAEAKVLAVDYDDRSIAIEGPQGNTHIFHVTSAVRNFYQIKKGDTVRVSYYSRLAANVRKVSDPPTTTIIDAVQLADLGKKPGIVCTRHAQVEATVASINYQTRELKLKTTTGAEIALTADKKLPKLESVKTGDQVVFDYAEALAINVD